MNLHRALKIFQKTAAIVLGSPRTAVEICKKYMDLKFCHIAVTWPVSAFHNGQDILAACYNKISNREVEFIVSTSTFQGNPT